MTVEELELDDVLDLLDKSDTKEVKRRVTHHPIPEQTGQIKRYDKEFRCMSRRCGSPTHLKLRGMALCYTHLIDEVNRILGER